jgi:hypothetical protein
MEWCVISIRLRKAPAAVSRLFARLEQAFAHFAQVPYPDARSLRELEQVSDDLTDSPEETPPRRWEPVPTANPVSRKGVTCRRQDKS